MRSCKKVLFIICISLEILFCGTVKNVLADDFDIFVSSISINNYDIVLSDFDNPLIWTRSLTDLDFASSGTIRGASGSDISILSGGGTYKGFHLFDLSSFGSKEIHFIDNIEFSKFNNAFDSLLSDISFDADKINFSSNTNTAVSIRRSTISFNSGSVNFISNVGSAIDARASSVSFHNQITNFINNRGEDGGAIFAVGSTVSFYNSTVNFIGNQVRNSGGAFFITNSIIDFDGADEINFIKNTALDSLGGGGAVYFSNSVYSRLALLNPSFIDNYTDGRGGAILIQGDGSQITLAQIIAQDRDVVFSGNKANDNPNDIHFVGNAKIDFNAAVGRKIELNGGITAMSANNTIEKSGDGVLYFNAGSSISFNGNFNITAGGVIFATNAYINTLNISANASLGASIDFVGKLSSILYLNSITIGANVDLFVQTINHASVVGSSSAFIYTNETSPPSNFASVIDVDGYTYLFSWNLEDGIYKGYLIYGALFNWNDFIGKYQSTTINNKLLTLREDIKATVAYNMAFGTPIDNNFTIEGQGYTLDADNYTDLGFVFNNSSAAFKNISFKNFSAASEGAVMKITGTSSIIIKAQNQNIAFTNNRANGVDNDIYLAGSAALEFSAARGRKIEIGGGIKSASQDASIKKSGSGDLIFLSNANIDFSGTIDIENGAVFVQSDADGKTIKLSTLTLSRLGQYSTQNSYTDETQIENSAIIDGSLYIDASNLWADTMTADNISLGRTSALFVNNLGLTRDRSIVIMIANIGRNGDFLGGISDDNYGEYSFNWNLEDGVYKGYLTFVRYAPPIDPNKIIAQTMIANTLSLSARNANIDEIYNRLTVRVDESDTFWFSLSGGANTFDKFDSSLFGLTAGADFYNSRDYAGGIFVKYNTNSVKEEGNEGEIKDIEIGLYGGSLGLFGGKANLKSNISMGFQDYDIKVEDNLKFKGKTIKGGFEFEHLSILKPFIGFQFGYASNEDAQNAQMVLYKDTFIRIETRFGLGLKGSNKSKKFHWHSRLYAIVPITGSYAEYKITDISGESKIKSIKESSIQPAFSIGGEYEITYAVSITANIRADYNKGFGYLGTVGTSVKF